MHGHICIHTVSKCFTNHKINNGKPVMTETQPKTTCTSTMSKICIPTYTIIVLSGSVGCIALLFFIGFIYTGLPSHINFGLNDVYSLALNSLLCLLFFFQHSLMIRSGFREWLSGIIPSSFHGAIFSIISGMFLLNLMLFWQKTTVRLYELDGVLFWAMRSVFFLSIIAFYLTERSLRPFDLFGIREISSYIKGKTARSSVFVVRGMYGWVRHPLYCIFLVILWTPVYVTVDRLMFNLLWTAWIITGTILEERDLIKSFGDEYRTYKYHVPMLIPYKISPWKHTKKR